MLALMLGALAVATGILIRAHAAPAAPHYFSEDQQVYLAMARAPFSDDREVRHAPGSWRILPALLARGIGAFGGGPERGFLLLMFATFAVLPFATLAWCEALGISRTSAIGCAAVMALAPPIVGLFAWDVVRVDALGLLLMFVAATAVVRARAAWLLAAVAALSLTKETAVLAAFFAMAWALLVNRRFLGPAVASVLVAVGIRLLVQHLLPPSQEYPFDNLAGFRGVIAELAPTYVARRALLTTAGTWNVMVAIMAAGFAARRWTSRDVVFAATLVVTMLQLLFASDNERVVAAGYPFVLALSASQLDGLAAASRRWAAAGLALFQIPWLVAFGRVWPVPPAGDGLPHFPPLRYVEIAIVLVSVLAAIAVFAQRRRDSGSVRRAC